MRNVVEAIIEIPMKTKNKFEIDHESGRIKLDRVLHTTMSYPAEYGYIDKTLAKDGDPLDIVVLSSEPTIPGCIVDSRIIGYLDVIDNGKEDYKVIAVVDRDPRFDQYQSLKDIPGYTLEEIKNFFQNYKTLQNIKVEVGEFHSIDETLDILKQCQERYQKEKCTKK